MPAQATVITGGQLEWEDREWFPPGPQLAICLSGGKERLARLTDDELLQVAAAARRQTSWAQARELAAIAELARRRTADEDSGDPDYRILSARESVTEEVAAALTVTGNTAATLVNLAERLTGPLTRTGDALGAGHIDLAKARVICDVADHLPERTAQRVESAALDKAPEQTTGQLRRRIKRIAQRLAPQAIEERKQEAVRHRRLELWDTPSGTTDLGLCDLRPEDAHAIYNKITAAAHGIKTDGDTRPLNTIRADLATRLLHGTELPDAIRDLLPQTCTDRHPVPAPAPDDPPSVPATAHPHPASTQSIPNGTPPPGTVHHLSPNPTHRTLLPLDHHAQPTPTQPTPAQTAPTPTAPTQLMPTPTAPTQTAPTQPIPAQTARGQTASGGSARGWSTSGQSARGQTGSGGAASERSADGQSARGQTGSRGSASERSAGGWSAGGGSVVGWAVGVAGGGSGGGPRPGVPPGGTVSVAGHRGMCGLEVSIGGRLIGAAGPSGLEPGSEGPSGGGMSGDLDLAGLADVLDRRLGHVRGRVHPEQLPYAVRRAAQRIQRELTGAREAACRGAEEVHGRPGYRPSAALRREIEARHATCVFPTCNQPSHRCDLDHTVPWRPGTTCRCNLAPLCRRHHRLKQRADWRLFQVWVGLLIWVTPSGAWYIVPPDRQ